jgi:signal transduction histidine kinase
MAVAATLLVRLVVDPAACPAASALPVLTTTRQVHQLSTEEAAKAYPVNVRGVVTFCDEAIGQLFVQDDTGGIFVEIGRNYGFALQMGQNLEIEGVSASGGFAPDIAPRQIRLLATAPLPAARTVTYEQMGAGQEDCNWVAFSGIVRSVGPDPFTTVGLTLAGGGGRVMVPIKNPDPQKCAELIDAEVTVRGVCIAHFNRRGQLIQIAVQLSTMHDITVDKPAPLAPFELPTRKISGLLGYAPGDAHGHRVKVAGVVTLHCPGESLFIADASQGLYVRTSQTNSVTPGDRVEVLGFPEAGDYVAPVLEDAMFRKVSSGPPLTATPIAAEDGSRDTNHAALVQVDASVLNRVERQREQLLELESGPVVFNASVKTASGPGLSLKRIPVGSRVLVTGVCLVPEDRDWLSPRQQSFSMVLRSAADIDVIQCPSWWTAQHTLWVLVGTLVVFFASLAWLVILRRQVAAQTRLIGEKLQREAALEERTRIARDLHDDLGASLTHISFLSEVARKERQGTTALNEYLEDISSSTQQAFQALDEIVWVVDPKHDTIDGLTGYICQFARDFFEGTPTRCRFDLPASLPEVPVPTEVRNNLFFAVKEALNNVRKHAAASEVVIRVGFDLKGSEGRHLRGGAVQRSNGSGLYSISIEDNGRGVAKPENRPTGNGLENMRQRLEKIGGRFQLETAAGKGTRIDMDLPLPCSVARG